MSTSERRLRAKNLLERIKLTTQEDHDRLQTAILLLTSDDQFLENNEGMIERIEYESRAVRDPLYSIVI